MLRRGARLASDAGDCATALWAYRELAFVDVQAGRRESARQWLDLATPLATTDGERAGILGVRGMDASDAGDYPNAFVHLGASVDYALRAGDERQAAWSLSLIGRAHLLRGEHRLARKALARSAELVDKQRWLAFQPWPQALQGELDLHGGDWKAATNRLEQAWTLACQVEDPCWESISARGLGLLHAAGGDPRGAGEWLTESTTRARRTSDRYVWMLGHALDAATAHSIQSHDHDRAARLLADLTALASRASMRELLIRAHLHRHSLGDSTALPTARRLAADIDNPALHDALRG